MAWPGTAHGEPMSTVSVKVQVKNSGQVLADFVLDIDLNHVAAQVKRDILDNQRVLTPPEMCNNSGSCLLCVCSGGGKVVVDNNERLMKFCSLLYDGVASLELLEPNASVNNDHQTLSLTDDLKLQQRNTIH